MSTRIARHGCQNVRCRHHADSSALFDPILQFTTTSQYTALDPTGPISNPRPLILTHLSFYVSSSVTTHRDLPPKGGYEPIRYKRNLPGKGPGGIAIFGGVLAICGYGFWRVVQGNLEQR